MPCWHHDFDCVRLWPKYSIFDCDSIIVSSLEIGRLVRALIGEWVMNEISVILDNFVDFFYLLYLILRRVSHPGNRDSSRGYPAANGFLSFRVVRTPPEVRPKAEESPAFHGQHEYCFTGRLHMIRLTWEFTWLQSKNTSNTFNSNTTVETWEYLNHISLGSCTLLAYFVSHVVYRVFTVDVQ